MQTISHLLGLALDCITCGFPLELFGYLQQPELDYADADLLGGHNYSYIICRLYSLYINSNFLYDTVPRELISS